MQIKYYFLTHPEKESREPYPALTKTAKENLVKRSTEDKEIILLFKKLKPTLIGVGTGMRFCQTYEYFLQNLFPDIRVIYSDTLGTDVSGIFENSKKWIVLPNGARQLPENVVTEGDSSSESAWIFLRTKFHNVVSGNKLFVCGNRFLSRLGVKSHSFSLYEVCPNSGDCKCLMERGKIL